MIMVKLIGAIAALMLLTLLPFFPGQYDTLAVPLSALLQILAVAALVLVPIGAAWLIAARSRPLGSKQFVFAAVALAVSSVLWLLVVLGTFVSGNVAFAAGALALWGGVLLKVRPALTVLRAAPPRPAHPAAYWMLVLPPVVVALQVALIPPAIERSRSRAIRNSAPLIAAIEEHRTRQGRYPSSLLAVHPDYRPGVIGIERYHYELAGEAYNLVFEQLSSRFGTREFVVYNPLDQQAMTSHAADLLQYSGGGRGRPGGYYERKDTGYPHWASFLFD